MSFKCLNKNVVNEFLQKLKDGEFNPQQLSEMTSAERRKAFEFMGEEAAFEVNAKFEKALLLKNQQLGIVNWAKEISGIKEPARRDLISRVEKMEEILTPDNEAMFLSDLAAKRLGITVSSEEAATIMALSKDLTLKKAELQSGGDRLEYGRSIVKFNDYINELKLSEMSSLQTLLGVKNLAEQSLKNPAGAAKTAAVELAGLTKALKASFDNSVIGRQGLKTLFSNPDIWLKNSVKSYKDMAKAFTGKAVLAETRADILSRPNAINGMYKREKLAVGSFEEAFPPNILERIPGVKNLYKASQEAFTSFQYKTRADVFDRYVQIAERTGADTVGIGKVVNSLTGRGDLGKLEAIGNELNNVFFSTRWVKSNFDFLTAHQLVGGKGVGKFAKQQAAYNLASTIIGVGVILSIADRILPGSVEYDPRSSDFGKIKVGNTRFGIAGGFGPIVVLASRLFPTKHNGRWGQYKKVTSNGKVVRLGGYGAAPNDLIEQFFENKLSPTSALLWKQLLGEEADRLPPGEAIADLVTPLSYQTYEELENDPSAADTLGAMIASFNGIDVQTYSKKKKRR